MGASSTPKATPGRGLPIGLWSLMLGVGIARADVTGIPGWQKEWPSPQQMLQAAIRFRSNQMGRYTVEPLARNKEQCDQYRGFWTGGECRISQALNPGSVQPNEGQLREGGSLRQWPRRIE